MCLRSALTLALSPGEGTLSLTNLSNLFRRAPAKSSPKKKKKFFFFVFSRGRRMFSPSWGEEGRGEGGRHHYSCLLTKHRLSPQTRTHKRRLKQAAVRHPPADGNGFVVLLGVWLLAILLFGLWRWWAEQSGAPQVPVFPSRAPHFRSEAKIEGRSAAPRAAETLLGTMVLIRAFPISNNVRVPRAGADRPKIIYEVAAGTNLPLPVIIREPR